MFGGKLLAMMDIIAGIAATRFSCIRVTLASTDSTTFMAPLHVGDRVQVIARVVWTGRTSMVVKTDVFGEEMDTGTRKHCTSSHFIMIAIDENHLPTPVPPLLIETDEEMNDFKVAEKIKNQALIKKQNPGQQTP
jgi:acyl-CoA hydrolase